MTSLPSGEWSCPRTTSCWPQYLQALTRDFSWSVIEALRSYDAERTGVPCPAFLLKNATQARQAFHGSVLRRRDGTYHVVDFTGGVKTSGDAICLMLKPLAGGPAKQFYPAELAQSVEWISMAWWAHGPSPRLTISRRCRSHGSGRMRLEGGCFSQCGFIHGASILSEFSRSPRRMADGMSPWNPCVVAKTNIRPPY